MNTFIAGLALLSAFITLVILHYTPYELDRMKASFTEGMLYLGAALIVCIAGMLLTVLEFNS